MADKLSADKPQIRKLDVLKSMCSRRFIWLYLLGLFVLYFFFKLSLTVGLVFLIFLFINFRSRFKEEKEFLDQQARKDAFVARMKYYKVKKKEQEQTERAEVEEPSVDIKPELIQDSTIIFEQEALEDFDPSVTSEEDLTEIKEETEYVVPIEDMPEPTREPYENELVADYDALRYYITHTVCDAKNEGDLFVGIQIRNPEMEYEMDIKSQLESWASNYSNRLRRQSNLSSKDKKPIQKSLFDAENSSKIKSDENQPHKPSRPVIKKQYIPKLSATWVNGYYNEEGVYIAGHFEE